MVVDEELKMMSAVCPDGGRIRGPFLKRMSRLTHTEYLLEGRSALDPREVLRQTMFAPTVTGSPMGNACTVIARHERRRAGTTRACSRCSRRDRAGSTSTRRSSSAPPTSTTPAGCACPSARRSCGTPTRRARSPRRRRRPPACSPRSARSRGERPHPSAASTPTALDTLLASRNDRLAAFWRSPQAARPSRHATAIVIDAGDDFTTMLAHQLRHLGLEPGSCRGTRRRRGIRGPRRVRPRPRRPAHADDPRVARLRELIATRLASGRPLLAVCLSHQVLADLAGLPLAPLPRRARACSSRSTCSASGPRSASTTRSRRSRRRVPRRRGSGSRWPRMPRPAWCTRCAGRAWHRCRDTSSR